MAGQLGLAGSQQLYRKDGCPKTVGPLEVCSKGSEKTFREKALEPWFFAFTFHRQEHSTDLLPGCDIPAITLKAQQTSPLSQQQQAPIRKGGRCGACSLGTHDILWSCVFVCVSVWLCGVCIHMFIEVRGHPECPSSDAIHLCGSLDQSTCHSLCCLQCSCPSQHISASWALPSVAPHSWHTRVQFLLAN